MKKKERELPLDSVLNPEIRMSTDFHFRQAFLDEDAYAGDSLGEHTAIEQANEYLADEELQQIFHNS
ncbi:hypothetical protein [Anoxybacteroides tepidamans]|uniref:hypothetical protein n=1 Tax=Anoxybacteroides tepidamans TaxID=265948 RepID=UPI000485C583|nr:hypothetical protein [Anoxybacillus tepidamans]